MAKLIDLSYEKPKNRKVLLKGESNQNKIKGNTTIKKECECHIKLHYFLTENYK